MNRGCELSSRPCNRLAKKAVLKAPQRLESRLPLTHCVVLDKLLMFSKLHFPQPQMGICRSTLQDCYEGYKSFENSSEISRQFPLSPPLPSPAGYKRLLLADSGNRVTLPWQPVTWSQFPYQCILFPFFLVIPLLLIYPKIK